MRHPERKPLLLALAAFPALFLAAGCARNGSMSGSFYSAPKSNEAASYDLGAPAMLRSTADADEAAVSASYERKLIQRGSLSLEVQSLAEARTAIESSATALGGYIESSDEYPSWISLTVRIPASSFTEAFSEASELGTIRSKHVSSDDVTEQFYDLDARLSSRRILLERLEQHLREASTMEDILDVEEKINSVTTELEWMQGQMNRLSSQIDFATLSIDAHLPANRTESGFVLPDTKSSFRDFLGNTASFFSTLLIALLYILAFGIPLVLLAALFWYLCFGKLGLVRKLFTKAGGKKKKEV